MRKLFTFIAVMAVVFAVMAPSCKANAFAPPTDSVVVKAFPNPTANQIKIVSTKGIDLWNAKIVISSSTGEHIFTRQFLDGSVDLETISRYRVGSGVYLISVITEKGEVLRTKVIKFHS